MDPKTNTIVRDGKQAVINPFDASALECALALKDDFIGFGMDVRVTVVSMGIPATESLLRDCIARGADDALLLTDRAFAGADTLATTTPRAASRRSTRTSTCSSAARWRWTVIRPRLVPNLPVPLRSPA
ncbi:MAG: electron transfer flavoprotein subunit beta/FixA family protein [Collinsella sp.]